MKLYYNKHTRATRPRWLIEEAGLDVEVVPVDLAAGEQRQDAYRAVQIGRASCRERVYSGV